MSTQTVLESLSNPKRKYSDDSDSLPPSLLRITLPDGKSYEDLIEPEQDGAFERLDLTEDPKQAQIQGLLAWGFASCFAIIIKSRDRISLSHVSSLIGRDADFLQDEADFVSGKEKLTYTIQLARSHEDFYEACRDQDPEDGDPPAAEYFPKASSEISAAIEKILRKAVEEEIIIMPNAMLMIDRDGNINTFSKLELYEKSAEGLGSAKYIIEPMDPAPLDSEQSVRRDVKKARTDESCAVLQPSVLMAASATSATSALLVTKDSPVPDRLTVLKPAEVVAADEAVCQGAGEMSPS